MNERSLIKYKHDDDHGLMHYVIFEGDVVVLSQYESKKVTYIENHNELDITFDIKSRDFDRVKVGVVTDPEYVQKVYDYMIEINNAYFKDGTDGLCVIKFEKK